MAQSRAANRQMSEIAPTPPAPDSPASEDRIDVMGPFALDRAMAKPDAASVPVRGDLAHIALAGVHFVPHYAVPQTYAVGPSGADVTATTRADADVRGHLDAGATFAVLDVEGDHAWGCAGDSMGSFAPIGWVALDRLSLAS